MQRARQIAAGLRQEGAVKGDRIGLCCRREEGVFEGMLGILLAGCAYVPFLQTNPVKRISYMMQTAGVKIALCGKAALAKLAQEDLPCRCVALDSGAGAPYLPCETGGEDLMYVLYTSGSTGQPKGVMLRHQALSNLLGGMKEWMAGLDGPILCTTNVVFDTFITESLLPLAMGIPVVLADDEQMLLPWETAALMERYAVKMMQFTPSRLRLCLGSDAFCAAAPGLDRIILVGEAVSEGLFRDFRSVSKAKVFNLYGPTEAAVYVTAAQLQEGVPVHIGKPLRNCRVYVLDEKRNPVFPSACGELYLAGDCLAAGYIGREDLTAQAFLPDPFFPGEKMYRSGDMGRLRADGNLDFLGRRDAQVKINGQRVELDEIREAIGKIEPISEAAVLPLKKADGSAELLAFFTCTGENPPAAEQIQARLQEQLPSYMVPSSYRRLPQMPYTASGKLDLPARGSWHSSRICREKTGKNPNQAPKRKKARHSRLSRRSSRLPRRRRPGFGPALCSQAARRMLPGQSRTGIWAERTSCCKFGSRCWAAAICCRTVLSLSRAAVRWRRSMCSAVTSIKDMP